MFSHCRCSCVYVWSTACACLPIPSELFIPCPDLTLIWKVQHEQHGSWTQRSCWDAHTHINKATRLPPLWHTHLYIRIKKKLTCRLAHTSCTSFIMPPLASPREDVEFYAAIHRSPNSLVQMSLYAEHTLFLQACFMCLCGVLQPS